MLIQNISPPMMSPMYVECDKMYQSKVCVKNSGISCLARPLIFNLNNPRTTVLYAKKLVAGGEIRRVIPFFLVIETNQWLSG